MLLNKTILLQDIQNVKLFGEASILTNGVIQITVGNQVINLAYGNKSKEDAAKALAYLQDNCSRKDVTDDRIYY